MSSILTEGRGVAFFATGLGLVLEHLHTRKISLSFTFAGYLTPSPFSLLKVPIGMPKAELPIFAIVVFLSWDQRGMLTVGDPLTT